MTNLFTGIGQLVVNDPGYGDGSPLGIVDDAAFVVGDDGRIEWIGAASSAPEADAVVDFDGRAVIPGFVDSHAHLVFAGDRAGEFAARMSGRPYTAGGIRTTVAATRAASDDVLQANLRRLTAEMRRQGTTTLECKSGYGLTVDDEQRSVTLARDFADAVTLLGAHVVPPEYADRPDEYVDLVRGPMLDACAADIDYVDVFCEKGAFDADQTRAVLDAARARELGIRLHANQLGEGPGVQIAVEYGAASADHCTHLSDADVESLASSTTVATLLPGVEFSTRSPYPDARKLLDAGATVALATDCNPGSCYTSSMPLCIALAVREMHMTPAEALLAATRGGAAALGRDDVGRLALGARADFAVLNAPSYLHLAYRPGVPLVDTVWMGGAIPCHTYGGHVAYP